MAVLDNYFSDHTFSVLYVEDDGAIREQMVEFLGYGDCKVYVANNGQEGWELYQKHVPSLVITDINMPVMNGLEMSRKIRAISPLTPIIMVTAFVERESLFEAIEVGVCSYVYKPVDFLFLQKKINRCKNFINTLSLLQYLSEAGYLPNSTYPILCYVLSFLRRLSAEEKWIAAWRIPVEPWSKDSVQDDLWQELTESIIEVTDEIQRTIHGLVSLFAQEEECQPFSVREIFQTVWNLFIEDIGYETIQYQLHGGDIELSGPKHLLIKAIFYIFYHTMESYKPICQERRTIDIFIDGQGMQFAIRIMECASQVDQSMLDRTIELFFGVSRYREGVGLLAARQMIELYFLGSFVVTHQDGFTSFLVQFPGPCQISGGVGIVAV